MTNEYYLGVDLGSVSLDGIVIDSSEKVLWQAYRKVQGRSQDAVVSLCRDLLQDWLAPRKLPFFHGAMATGSGKEIVEQLLALPRSMKLSPMAQLPHILSATRPRSSRSAARIQNSSSSMTRVPTTTP